MMCIKMLYWCQNSTKTRVDADKIVGHFVFMSLIQVIQVNKIYQTIGFLALYNNGLTMLYGKTLF